jgi:ubiquitin-like modifier-activating enzyme ATG7
VFRNYNTIEDFKAADKNALLNAVADQVHIVVLCFLDIRLSTKAQIYESIVKTRSTEHLNRFVLITFADLKK